MIERTFLALASCVLLISGTKIDCGERKNIQNKTCDFFHHIKPLRYQVYIDPCINDGNFSGYVHIDLLILRPTKNVSLHSQELNFCDEGVYLALKGRVNDTFDALTSLKDLENDHDLAQHSDEALAFSSETVRPCKFIYRKQEQIVTIKFEEIVRPGRYTLEINYMGTINNDPIGVYRRYYKDDDGQKNGMLLTNFFPTSARRVFPCRDELGAKAEIHFTIQTSLNYTTLMPKTPKTCVEFKEGQKWSHSHPTSNISTYQLNFAVIKSLKNLTKTNENKTYIMYATATDLKSVKLAQNTHMKAMSLMENLTKINYPLNTIITLIIPEKADVTSSASMGFITLKKTQNLYNDKSGPQKKKDVVLQASRDIVSQWFNHLISPVSWKHMWLNDALTEYIKYYIADKIMPNWRLREVFVVWELQRKSFIPNKITDSFPLNEKLYVDNPEDIQCLLRKSYSSRVVGASLIRMMSYYLSEDIILSGITNFLKANKYKAVRLDHFWNAVQNTINASEDTRFKNISIAKVMESWVNTELYPIIIVKRNYTDGSIEVSQTPAVTFFGLTENNVTTKWWIPINYATQSNPNFNTTYPTHWLKPEMEQLIIKGVDSKDWVVFNIQQTGYYRVLYDKENWKRLAGFLNSENYDKISPINRAQIINDAVQFSLKRHLDMDVFLDLLSYLRKERDYIPWYDAQFIFSFLNYHLANTHAYPSLKKFSLFLITPIADKIGYKDRPDDDFLTLLLRRITNYWACHFGYEKCWNNATQQLEAYLDNKKSELGSIDIQDWAQCVGLHGANESIWNRMLDKYKEKQSEDVLIHLGCSENSSILNNFLNMTTTNNETIPEKQVLSVFKAVCLYPSGDDKRINICLNFINNHFDKILLRLGNATDSFTQFLDLLGSEIRQTSQFDQFKAILSREKAAFILDKLNGRIKQTENRISVFDQKANYYGPFLKGQIAQLC